MLTMQAPPESTNFYWEHFDHEAGIGIRGFGATLPEAFTATALALTAAVTDPASVTPSEEVDIQLPADGIGWQLYDFLNLIIYEMASRNMLFSEYQVQFVKGVLVVKAFGEVLDLQKHKFTVGIKKASLTELKVDIGSGVCSAQCVLDV